MGTLMNILKSVLTAKNEFEYCGESSLIANFGFFQPIMVPMHRKEKILVQLENDSTGRELLNEILMGVIQQVVMAKNDS